jgi:hypothetical protein
VLYAPSPSPIAGDRIAKTNEAKVFLSYKEQPPSLIPTKVTDTKELDL